MSQKLVKALCDHITDDPTLLSFRHGDIFQVVERLQSGWWEGSHDDKIGLFPSQFVTPLTPEEEQEWNDKVNELSFPEPSGCGKRYISGSGIYERKSSNVSFTDEESILPSFTARNSFIQEEEDSLIFNEELENGDLHPTEQWRTTLFHSLYNEIIPREYTGMQDTSKTLPLYWGVHKTLDDQVYYFNMVTDQTLWELPTLHTTTRILPKPLSRLASSRNSVSSHSSGSSDDSDTISDPLFEGSARRSRRPSGFVSSLDGDKSGTSWASATSKIVLCVHRLNHAIKHGIKWDFTYHASSIARAIRQLLIAAGVTDQDSAVLGGHALLKAHHSHMIEALGAMMLAARVAAGVWPPPDAASKLQQSVNEVLLTVRHFVNTAQENGVRVQEQEIDQTEPSCEDVIDGLQRLGELVLKVSGDVIALTRVDGDDLSHLASAVHRIVLHSGDVLDLVNSLSFSDSPERMASTFNSYRDTMIEEVGRLAVAVQDLELKQETIDTIQRAAAAIDCSSYRLLIGAKFLQEERDAYELQQLGREVGRIKGSTASTSIELLLNFRPRRAMSMSFYTVNGQPAILRPNQPVGQSVPPASGQRSLSSPAPSIRPVHSVETFPRLMYPTDSQPTQVTHISRHSMTQSIASSASSTPEDEPTPPYSEAPPSRNRSVRVPSETPWFLEHNYAEDSIVIVDNVVKGGTIVSLVERLTSHDTLDTSFIATFLLTYRSFTSTVQFFDLLFRRFNLQCPPGLQPDEQEQWKEKKLTPVRLRVFNIMKLWLETYYNEGEDAVGLENLRQFACTTMNEVMPKAAVLIVQLISKRRESSDAALRKMVRNARSAPPPLLPKNLAKFRLLDLDPLEIARQLTIMDSNYYNKIKPTEFLNKAWSRKDNNGYVNIMTEMSNKVTRWVADSILTRKDTRKRVTMYRHFVAVMEKCHQLNNFNSLMSILAGFALAPVYRLKRTNELVPPKVRATLDHHKQMMESSRNFARYREMLHSIDPPCVPFLGIYLTDLTFNDDGNSDYLPSKPHLINFSKQAKTAETIREIQQFQNSPYALDSVAEIQEFILKSLDETSDVAVLYEISLKLEPREREDEKIARLLHESGFL
ncbi:hypothetical protein DSO57_1012156 [Entomophthora muscae]|uniref:Uncharacterized protein n=1 Tax=Entomophthora muscae TaxID=34485 RepID=A0ACC2SUW3_9FUNG|nr:hypothetical protein DSO57_1012156 [Entomophthora muscae]